MGCAGANKRGHAPARHFKKEKERRQRRRTRATNIHAYTTQQTTGCDPYPTLTLTLTSTRITNAACCHHTTRATAHRTSRENRETRATKNRHPHLNTKQRDKGEHTHGAPTPRRAAIAPTRTEGYNGHREGQPQTKLSSAMAPAKRKTGPTITTSWGLGVELCSLSQETGPPVHVHVHVHVCVHI